MTLGQKLKELRKSKSITSEAAAKELGVSLSSYRNYEQDRTKPRGAEIYEKIAMLYGVTVKELQDVSDAPANKSVKKSAPKKAAKKSVTKKATAKKPVTIDDQIAKAEKQLAALKKQKEEAEQAKIMEEYADLLPILAESGLTKSQIKKAIADAVKAKKKPAKKRKAKKPAEKPTIVKTEVKLDYQGKPMEDK